MGKVKPHPNQREHDFVLVLSGISSVDTGVEDALFDAGCDDATISVRSARVYLTFSRLGASMKDAILSAIQNVRSANIGADVLRVDYSSLVSQADIARKIGRSRQLVHQYTNGSRGPGGFPSPVCEICEEAPLWSWSEVASWLWENGMLEESALRDAQEIEVINSVLEMERQRKTNPELTREIERSVQSGASGK